MTYAIKLTERARGDLKRLYAFMLDRDEEAAARALDTITQSMELLKEFPFSCRKATGETAFLRELLVPFGSSGYIVLFRIDNDKTVTIAAVRHQREDDYH
ncbi:type II toxin-antitoxin system RelE/ParE family toxin [Neorhizobium galegae]|uniref:type II toxin-antitoxin system RelE/ParE family toxin n=1 Tax=Neorhizobium galegae TaxID=399 RepID=UPI0021010B3E|nr:type II toxin-antitoxin system RelE/ParE family toxin [Neorhizobium galegae]MCQ1569802.1 type II toxin-antitoxin system RelE/ParE family toxin [Neorhizobium galegae]